MEDAAQQVSPQVVGPQQIAGGCALHDVRQVYFLVGVGRQTLGKHRDENQDHDENPAGGAQGLLLPQPG